MVQPDSLHILAADIEKERDIRHVLESGLRVGNGLHNVVLGGKRPGEQQLAVSGRAAAENI